MLQLLSRLLLVGASFLFARRIWRVITGRRVTGSKVTEDFSVSVVRPDDLLVLRFGFRNFALVHDQTTGQASLRRTGSPACLVVHFPPQSIVEEAISENDPLRDPPLAARMAGESRLVFRIPDSISTIEYSLEALLDWSRFTPHVAAVAKPPPGTTSNLPAIFSIANLLQSVVLAIAPRSVGYFFGRLIGADELSAEQSYRRPGSGLTERPVGILPPIRRPDGYTALEIPYRLILSPNSTAGWAHSPAIVAHGDRAELWHSRLGVAGKDGRQEWPGHDTVDELSDETRTLRAIWSPDFPEADDDPFLMPLIADDRRQLVNLTSDFGLPNTARRVIRAERLMLTALGAWMNTRYADDKIDEFDLTEWRHRMALGRDHYVRVVHEGYLFPFGHRAARIAIYERKFAPAPQSGQTVAFVRKREFIIVRQPEKTFRASGLKSPDGKSIDLMMPFERVRIATLVTPDLVIPAGPAFWIRAKTKTGLVNDVPFHLVATDVAGQSCEFTAGLIFVTYKPEPPPAVETSKGVDGFAFDQVNATSVKSLYEAADESRRRCDLGGQKVAFATPTVPGDTTLETESLLFSAVVPTTAAISNAALVAMDQPRFYPCLVNSQVAIPAVQKLLGQKQSSAIKYHDTFLTSGFVDNPGEVFAELIQATSLRFTADKSGGVVTPNFDITGLTRKLGPVGGALNEVVNANFKPTEFFKGALDAKILGAISLTEILKEIAGTDKFPQLVSENLPDSIRARLNWETSSLQNFGPFEKRPGAKLSLLSESVTRLPVGGSPPGPPTLHVEGTLTSFALNLFELITVPFDEFKFVADTGKKLDVTAKLAGKSAGGPVEFGGPLKFINTLAKIIPSDGFQDPPGIDVGPTGINVNYSLALPPIGGGVFSLSHVKFSAALNLPFVVEPMRLRFAFSERHDPFALMIYGITGGGFVGLALGLDGVESLEASFEVGGSLAISLAVVSGEVHIMLGIHFLWEKISLNEQRALLGGYVRAGGSVEVLGLVSVSIEFYMELGYVLPGPGNGTVHGEASVTVEIEIALFSKSVEFSVEKDVAAPA